MGQVAGASLSAAMVFNVYEATFERWDSTGCFHYAGMTEKSLQGRGASHAEMPVDWGRGMKRETLHLRCHKTFSCRKTALAEEARLAAALMHSDEEHARGGPWSLPRVMPRHRKEMEAVLGCGSASQVIRLAVEGTPLWKHLHDEPYKVGVGGRGGGGWTKVKRFNTKAKKKKLSGSERRNRDRLVYGASGYAAAKYGTTPESAEARIQATYNATRPGRSSGH